TEKTGEQPDVAAQPGPASVPAAAPQAVPAPPPQPVPPQPVLPQPLSPQPVPPKAPAPAWQPVPAWPAERARRGRGVAFGVALVLLCALAGSVAFLLGRSAGTAPVTAPATGASASAPPGTAAGVRDAAAAWVATQVSRAQPI